MSDDVWCRDQHEPCHIEHQRYSRAMGEECCIPTCDLPCCKVIVVDDGPWRPLPQFDRRDGRCLILFETNGVVIRSTIVPIVRLGPPPKKIDSRIPIAKVVRHRGVATK